jgi:hypothetical protein
VDILAEAEKEAVGWESRVEEELEEDSATEPEGAAGEA